MELRRLNIELVKIGKRKIGVRGDGTQKVVGLPDRDYKAGGKAVLYGVPGHPELLVLDLEMEEDDDF